MKMMFEENEPVVASSDDIVITACPTLVEENRATQEFLWGYYFCIENNSSERIQLVGKSWNITDDKGNRFCDDSAGFKGEIPELEPGESFEFTSLAPLTSPHAVFYGESAKKAVPNPKTLRFRHLRCRYLYGSRLV